MADITMCSGLGCPIKESCYRFTAPSGYFQYYFLDIPYKDGKCDMFWENKQDSVNKKQNKKKINYGISRIH